MIIRAGALIMPKTAAEKSLIGKIGIQTRLANEDPQAMTAAARSGFARRFYDQTDPALPEAERERRAKALMSAHMSRIRLRGVVNQRKARERAGSADERAGRRPA
jgi:hypothetical protein